MFKYVHKVNYAEVMHFMLTVKKLHFLWLAQCCVLQHSPDLA